MSILFAIGALCLPVNLWFFFQTFNKGIAYDAVLPLAGIFGGIVSLIGVLTK